MVMKKQRTLKEIVADCGGAIGVANASNDRVTNLAVYRWYQNGVRLEYWPLLLKLSKANDNPTSVCELYKANMVVIEAGNFSDKRRREK